MNEAGNEGGSVTVGLPNAKFRKVPNLKDPDARSRKVYFLYCAGFIKIGTARVVVRRVTEIQIGSPWKCQVVLLIPGGRLTEDYLHFVFQEYRVAGEWFRLGPLIREAIKELAPADCQEWLAKEEAEYAELIRQEAIRLGLLS